MVGLTVLATLAVWRVANMITDTAEIGPFRIFEWLRDMSWSVATWFGEGWNCIWCMSFWIAGIATAFACAMGMIPLELAPFWWPAVSALALFFNGVLKTHFM